MTVEFDDLEPLEGNPPDGIRNDVLFIPAVDDLPSVCFREEPHVVDHFVLGHGHRAAVKGMLYFDPLPFNVGMDSSRNGEDGTLGDSGKHRELDLELVLIDQPD